jgi:hypothetical protein
MASDKETWVGRSGYAFHKASSGGRNALDGHAGIQDSVTTQNEALGGKFGREATHGFTIGFA